MKNTAICGHIFARLRRDVVLRAGLISALASLIAMLLLSAITYWFLERKLEKRVEDALVARHEVASARADLSDEDQLLIQQFRKSLPVRDEGVFAWLDSEGVPLQHNVSGLKCLDGFFDGWLDVSMQFDDTPIPLLEFSQVDRSQHDRFLFLAQQQGDGCLVFGRSLYGVDAVHEQVLGLFLWLVPLCILPSIFISLNESLKLRRRLRRLGTVVSRIAGGDLEVRNVVNGDDDIDRLALSSNHSFDQLQESVNTMQQLTSVMAHDLRAPLSRVAIPLDEAVRANQSGRMATESLESVKNGLNDVRSVFDALLRITQIESGKRHSNFSKIDLFEIAERIYEIYQPVAEDAERTLEFEISGEGSSMVLGDTDLITQLLVNLVENATRYAPRGSIIRIGLLRDAKKPELIVQDNGPGLPETERTKVLRRLYRYKNTTQGKCGYGLGLSLVKAVVDLHDARIVLEDSNPGLLVRVTFDSVNI